MFYEKSNLFPQFIKNQLTFYTEKTRTLYAVADRISINMGYFDDEVSSNELTNNTETGNKVYMHTNGICIFM